VLSAVASVGLKTNVLTRMWKGWCGKTEIKKGNYLSPLASKPSIDFYYYYRSYRYYRSYYYYLSYYYFFLFLLYRPCYLLFYCTDVSFTATRDEALTVPDTRLYKKQRLKGICVFPFFKSVTNGYTQCAHW
jgi:hypothetical protein